MTTASRQEFRLGDALAPDGPALHVPSMPAAPAITSILRATDRAAAKRPVPAARGLPSRLAADIAAAATVRQMRGFAWVQPPLTVEQRTECLRRLRLRPQPEQRTPPWYAMREGMLTASDFQRALTSDASRTSFALDKADPRPFSSSGSAACTHGVMFEPVCGQLYTRLRDGAHVEEFGLLPHASCAFLGASPDGVCSERSPGAYVGRAVEFKAPYSRAIARGGVPTKYLAQMQGQLEVMQLPACDYLECELDVADSAEGLRALVDGRAAPSPSSPPPSSVVICGGVVDVGADAGAGVEQYSYTPVVEGADGLRAAVDSLTAAARAPVLRSRFWALRRQNLVTVYRNEAWFAAVARPALEAVWRKVEWFRARPAEVRSERAARRRARKPEKRAGYSFV